MNIIEPILQQMSGVSQAQKKFMVILFSTMLLVYGKVNFTNLGCYSSLSKKTYRRHFLKGFDFQKIHQYFVKKTLNSDRTIIAVIDIVIFSKKAATKLKEKLIFIMV